MRIYNESTKQWVTTRKNIQYGIVYIDDNYIEFGYFNPNETEKLVEVNDTVYPCINTILDKYFIYCNYSGFYIPTRYASPDYINKYTCAKGQGSFPYSFEKKYEAVENFSIFNNKHIIETNIPYKLAEYMPYTFGIEFETSMGYVPQDKCFKDGLIPLRDGSISGLEYSTIVLKGNEGLNLLHQQIRDLKAYTSFNKECSLHIHFGNYPITEKHLYILYKACLVFQNSIARYVPSLTFESGRYKRNGKNYCNPLPEFYNFSEIYKYMTDRPFFGDFTQPHPSDITKTAKWKISQRYYCVNFINALCYKGPKTIEFRFLRPTYNFRVIYLWLAIFNALLQKSEDVVNNYNTVCNTILFEDLPDNVIRPFYNIPALLTSVYGNDVSFCDFLLDEADKLYIAVRNQERNDDYCGRDISFINEIFNPEDAVL